jgi:hypothetical protein
MCVRTRLATVNLTFLALHRPASGARNRQHQGFQAGFFILFPHGWEDHAPHERNRTEQS